MSRVRKQSMLPPWLGSLHHQNLKWSELHGKLDIVLPLILKNEGGYVDDARSGRETNNGITMATLSQCSHPLLGLDPTSDNLKALTDAQAAIIYKSNYWNVIQVDSHPLQDLVNIVRDLYVNAGTHATALLQRVINGLGANLIVDGSIGPASIAALNALPSAEVYQQYKAGRIDYCQGLGQKYPQYLAGWINRVNEFPALSNDQEAPGQALA